MKLLYIVRTSIILCQYFARANLHRRSFSDHFVPQEYTENYRLSATSKMANHNQNNSATSSCSETTINASTRRADGQHDFSMNSISLFRNNFSIVRIPLVYPTPILIEPLDMKGFSFEEYTNVSFNRAIQALGVNNFMSYAAYFCKHESQGGAIEIVSVGSGDGSIERRIIETYRDHFGSTLNITLVDIWEKYKVDFRTVDDLIKKRPNVWPSLYDHQIDRFMGYEIESIRKLLPWAVLTVYETTGISGSGGFQMFLDKNKEYYRFWDSWDPKEEQKIRLLWNLYNVQEIVYQEVHTLPGHRFYQLRMVKVTKNL